MLLTGLAIGVALASIPAALLFVLLANRYLVDAGHSALGVTVEPVLLNAAIALFVVGILFAAVRNLLAPGQGPGAGVRAARSTTGKWTESVTQAPLFLPVPTSCGSRGFCLRRQGNQGGVGASPHRQPACARPSDTLT